MKNTTITMLLIATLPCAQAHADDWATRQQHINQMQNARQELFLQQEEMEDMRRENLEKEQDMKRQQAAQEEAMRDMREQNEKLRRQYESDVLDRKAEEYFKK